MGKSQTASSKDTQTRSGKDAAAGPSTATRSSQASSSARPAARRPSSLRPPSQSSPSSSSISVASTASPSRIAASPSATTSALSASPHAFNIGRSPSGGAYDSQGGAAARLRRVASNVSLAGTIRGVLTSGTTAQRSDKSTEDQSAPGNAAMETDDNVGASNSASEEGENSAPREDVAGRAESSSHAQPPEEQSEQSASLGVGESELRAKRPPSRNGMPSESDDQQPNKSRSRNTTWYGWSREPAQVKSQPDVNATASQEGGNVVRGNAPQKEDVDMPERQDGGQDAGQDVSQDVSQDGKQDNKRDESSTPAQPSQDQTGHSNQHQVEPAQPTTLRAPAASKTSAAQRSSWFAWRASSAQTLSDVANEIAPTSTSAGQNQNQDEQNPGRGSLPIEGNHSTNTGNGGAASETRNAQQPAQTGQQKSAEATVNADAQRGWSVFGRGSVAAAPSKEQKKSKQQDEKMDVDAAEPPGIEAEPGPSARDDAHHTTSQADPKAASAGSWVQWVPFVGRAVHSDTHGQPTSASQSAPQEETQPSTLTPAEQVKADALARPEAGTSSAAATGAEKAKSSSLQPRDAVLNPATRSSWISYFSSGNARPPSRIAPQEPEAMEVDFNENDPQQTPEGNAKDKSSEQASGGGQTNSVPDSSSQQQQQLSAKVNTAAKAATAKVVPAGLSSSKSSQHAPTRPGTPNAAASLNEPKPDPAPATKRPTTPLTGDKSQQQQSKRKPASIRPPVANLVLPTFEDSFLTAPRCIPPPAGMLKRTLTAVNTWFSGTPPTPAQVRVPSGSTDPRDRSSDVAMAMAEQAALRLPRSWQTMGYRSKAQQGGCAGTRRVVIVGIHGWFAQSWASRFMGEPTGTSIKFATGMRDAVLRHFKAVEGMELNPEAVTMIPLSADGTVAVRVDRSFTALLSRKEWVEHLAEADTIFFACHSQGCIVGANLLARLIEQNHIQPRRTRIALLAMCGIHGGPFDHIRGTAVSSYLTYFETAAAKELFEFQQSSSNVYQQYEHSLRIVLQAGAKLILVASTDDQVVPLHSALFTSANHPSILRALYIHGNTFPKLDFLTNMLTFCLSVRNAGLSDHDLLALLSASVAGSLYGGLGHSLCYEEDKTYDLAVKYLFQTTHPLSEPTTRSDEKHPPPLQVDHSSWTLRRTKLNSNPHLLPWSLRGILEDPAVRITFGSQIAKLLDDFESWKPTTKTLKDLQYRFEPMRSIERPAGAKPSAAAAEPEQAGTAAGKSSKEEQDKGKKDAAKSDQSKDRNQGDVASVDSSREPDKSKRDEAKDGSKKADQTKLSSNGKAKGEAAYPKKKKVSPSPSSSKL